MHITHNARCVCRALIANAMHRKSGRFSCLLARRRLVTCAHAIACTSQQHTIHLNVHRVHAQNIIYENYANTFFCFVCLSIQFSFRSICSLSLFYLLRNFAQKHSRYTAIDGLLPYCIVP